MKKLPIIRRLAYGIWLMVLLIFALASINQIRAQEAVDIPGPELRDASFIPVKDLKIGDWVFVRGDEGLIPEQITKLEYHQEEVEVYNLSVDGEQTFFANDFAVHNKTSAHETVCDLAVAPRMSIAPSETWTAANKGNAFRNMFQYFGIGRDGGGFSEESGGGVCFFGQGTRCQFFYEKSIGMDSRCSCCASTYWSCDHSCDDECRNAPNFDRCHDNCTDRCERCGPCGTNCNCTYKDWVSKQAVDTGWKCFPTCDWLCGPYTPWGYTAPDDTIRFRAADWCDDDDGCGCGAAVKVSAPDGYVIKSITFDVNGRLQYWNGDKNAVISVSRGMTYGLDCGTIPRGGAGTLTNMSGTVNDWRVDFHRQGTNEIGGTRYAFIHFDAFGYNCDGCDKGKYINSWAEIRDIKVELVPLEISTTEVTVINNCLLSYSGVPTNNPDSGIRWPTCLNGQIRFSNDGSNWSSFYPWSKTGPWTFDWTLDPSAIGGGDTWLWAQVICQLNKICKEGPLPIFIPTGTITGNVYSNEWGECSGNTGCDPANWRVTCKHSSWPQAVEAIENGNRFQCKDSSGKTDIPQGGYVIDISPVGDWRVITAADHPTCVAYPDPKSFTLDATTTGKGPDFYLWQGASEWYQTKEGDVHANEGTIISRIFPLNTYFSDADAGDYPGLVSYNSPTQPDFGRMGLAGVSKKGWLAEDGFSITHRFDSFYDKLGSPTEVFDCAASSSPSDGFYLANNPPGGNCVMNKSLDFGTKKVVIFVNGNLKFNKPAEIKISSGGFLAFIVKGDILISGEIGSKTTASFTGTNAHFQGVYFADGKIETYYDKGAGQGSGFRLVLAGIFVANEFSLRRNLKTDVNPAVMQNSNTPAELFIARPDLFVNIPDDLKTSYFFEQEVAP